MLSCLRAFLVTGFRNLFCLPCSSHDDSSMHRVPHSQNSRADIRDADACTTVRALSSLTQSEGHGPHSPQGPSDPQVLVQPRPVEPSSYSERWKCEGPTHQCGQMIRGWLRPRCDVYRDAVREINDGHSLSAYTSWWIALKNHL